MSLQPDSSAPSTHIIDGKKVISEESLPAINPATEEVIAKVPVATKKQLNEAIRTAERAFPSWSSLPVEERQKALDKLGQLFEQHLNDIVDLIVTETGKTKDISHIEAGMCVPWLREGGAKRSLQEEVLFETSDRKVITRYIPIGVVGYLFFRVNYNIQSPSKCAAITPWNFPMSLLMWKVVPALLAGNTLIVKPSPYAPLACVKFVEQAQQVLPPGVLNTLTGDNELGPWMVEHPGFKHVSMTGSITSGKTIMRCAATNLTRITLELGGNDPAIILPDIDPKTLAPCICAAIKRLYIHEEVYDALRDELVAYARTIKVGDPAQPDIGMGPVQNREGFNKVNLLRGYIDDCKKHGYRFVLGGEVDPSQKGYFVPITIVDNPPDDSKIVQEEPFGPIVPLLRWRDEDDVVRRANATQYGLSASIWGKDLGQQSGFGVEHGRQGLIAWTQIQTVTINRNP
ncbi:aldehyde dehydrogenase family protein [Obba rivulosa]|uniref:Aldehyde dehydrogenase family protein n=1 Tax=Obba rivulosa TaxID=1052685 RepID=A0A8E2AY35_9APHY|nr:aldehyde dehydrogenase family protein [Obba rivulosa]